MAAVPLKVTVFSLGVGLNPVPKIVTVVPTGPLAGLKSMSRHERARLERQKNY